MIYLKAYVKRDKRFLLVSAGFHVNVNKFVIESLLFNNGHSTECGCRKRASMNLDSHVYTLIILMKMDNFLNKQIDQKIEREFWLFYRWKLIYPTYYIYNRTGQVSRILHKKILRPFLDEIFLWNFDFWLSIHLTSIMT